MEKKVEKLDVKDDRNVLESKLSMITRKRPQIQKVEQSSVLNRVKEGFEVLHLVNHAFYGIFSSFVKYVFRTPLKALMPKLKKGEVDLWKQMQEKVCHSQTSGIL